MSHFAKAKDRIPLKERVVLTVEDAMTLSGFGQATIYRAIRAGRLTARKQGLRTIILRDEFDSWLRSLPKKV